MADPDSQGSLVDSDEVLKPFLQASNEFVTSSSSSSSDSGGLNNNDLLSIRTFVLKLCSSNEIFCGYDEVKVILGPILSGNDNGEKILRTLDLFSYGTYKDYVNDNNNKGMYLPLTESAITKLRQLSVLSLVQQSCNQVPPLTTTTSSSSTLKGDGIIPYHIIAQELGLLPAGESQTQSQSEFKSELKSESKSESDNMISVWRQVEEVILSCLYARVLNGQLCQKNKSLVISSRYGPPCRSRDVPLTVTNGRNGIDVMLETLQLFQQRLQTTCDQQNQTHKYVQYNVDANKQQLRNIMERKKKAETSSPSQPSSYQHHHLERRISGNELGGGGVVGPSSSSSGGGGGGNNNNSAQSSATRRSSSKRSREKNSSGYGAESFSRF